MNYPHSALHTASQAACNIVKTLFERQVRLQVVYWHPSLPVVRSPIMRVYGSLAKATIQAHLLRLLGHSRHEPSPPSATPAGSCQCLTDDKCLPCPNASCRACSDMQIRAGQTSMGHTMSTTFYQQQQSHVVYFSVSCWNALCVSRPTCDQSHGKITGQFAHHG